MMLLGDGGIAYSSQIISGEQLLADEKAQLAKAALMKAQGQAIVDSYVPSASEAAFTAYQDSLTMARRIANQQAQDSLAASQAAQAKQSMQNAMADSAARAAQIIADKLAAQNAQAVRDSAHAQITAQQDAQKAVQDAMNQQALTQAAANAVASNLVMQQAGLLSPQVPTPPQVDTNAPNVSITPTPQTIPVSAPSDNSRTFSGYLPLILGVGFLIIFTRG